MCCNDHSYQWNHFELINFKYHQFCNYHICFISIHLLSIHHYVHYYILLYYFLLISLILYLYLYSNYVYFYYHYLVLIAPFLFFLYSRIISCAVIICYHPCMCLISISFHVKLLLQLKSCLPNQLLNYVTHLITYQNLPFNIQFSNCIFIFFSVLIVVFNGWLFLKYLYCGSVLTFDLLLV